MADLEMKDADDFSGENLEQRVRRRIPDKADDVLAKLRENSITMVEIQHGITPADLIHEISLSEEEANAVALGERSWKEKISAQDQSWIDSVVCKLPSHFDEAMRQKVKSAILSAGIQSVDQLRGMNPEDLARAKVPLAARGWLSDNYNKRGGATNASEHQAPPNILNENPVLPASGDSNPKLVLNARQSQTG
jgi:hypothetical protein